MSTVQLFAWRIVALAAVLAVWQLAVWLEVYKPLVLKSPGDVWSALQALNRENLLVENFLSTLEATVVALGLGAIVGVPLGLVLALLPRTERVLSPFFDAMNSSPRIAFAPVFIVVFGLTQQAKIALALTVVLFILVVAARTGVHNADADVASLLRSMGANKRQVFSRLLLPAAIPSIFAGLRLGLTYSLLSVVASELIAAKEGAGQLIARYSATFQMERVYAVVLLLVLVATVLNLAMAGIERRLLRWQPERGF